MGFLAAFALTVLALPFSTFAHFEIKSPPGREASEDAQGQYPCSGTTAPGDRAPFPIAGGPIQLDMGHDRSLVQVNLAVGNDGVDGNAFNINLLPIVQEEGLGDFCLGSLVIPSNLNVKDGDNATLQVITNGESSPGLYNCADITFSSTASPGECTNGSNVRAEAYSGPQKNANGSDSSTATATNSAATPSATDNGAVKAGLFNGAFGCGVIFILLNYFL